jgi:hypothetical protein
LKSFGSDKRIQEMPVLLHLCLEILLEGKEEEVGFENVVHINQGSIPPTFWQKRKCASKYSSAMFSYTKITPNFTIMPN